MTFPSGTVISTANLDSPSGDPSLARADLYNAVAALNQLIASENIALGILTLGANGRIPTNYMPGSIAVPGNLELQPTSGIVSVNKVLRLTQINSNDLGVTAGTTSPSAGDICYLTNGDAGLPCLSVYDGTNWRIVRLATSVGSVGAAITATASLTAEADA